MGSERMTADEILPKAQVIQIPEEKFHQTSLPHLTHFAPTAQPTL